MGANVRRRAGINSVNVPSTRARGFAAEKRVLKYLENKDLAFVEKNYFSDFGEIDLIMRDGEYLVFIEVRKRKRTNNGFSIETVNRAKQLKIIRTATHYLQSNNLYDKIHCRFDVVGLDLVNGVEQITWVKAAFE